MHTPDTPECTSASAKDDITNENFVSLDYDQTAIFGGIALKNLSDEDLNDAHDPNLSQRRDKLVIATGLLNGCLLRLMPASPAGLSYTPRQQSGAVSSQNEISRQAKFSAWTSWLATDGQVPVHRCSDDFS